MKFLLGTLILLLTIPFVTSCNRNPFFPRLTDYVSSVWTPQTTVGELLTNFTNSYIYRDSLRYADCISENFVFLYFDADDGRFNQWYRRTDLEATGALFRTYSQIRLTFGSIPDTIRNFSYPDSLLSFQVFFNLEIGEFLPIFGYAYFEVLKESDGKFRIQTWRDDV
ncbi:MAG: hypothetical protein N2450_04170 [bacterium]|nr:hypothetical protein [bacterium]